MVGEAASGGGARTLRNLAWSASSFGLRGLASIGVLAFLARILAPADFGVATITVVVGNLCAYGAQMGLGAALVQAKAPSKRTVGALFSSTAASAMAVAALFSLGFGLLGTDSAGGAIQSSAVVYVVGVVALTITAVPEGLIQRLGRFRELALVEGAAFVTGTVVCGPILAWLIQDFRAILIATSTSHLISCALMLWLTRHEGWRSRPNWSGLGHLFRFGVWFSLSRVLNYASKEADNLVLGGRVGADAVGLYSRAYVLASMPGNYLGTAVERVYFPLLARQFHRDEGPVRTVLRAMEGVLAAGLVISVVLYLFAAEVILVILGDTWLGATNAFRILACVIGWRLAYKFSDAYAKATGGVRERAMREVVVLLFLLIGCVLAAPVGIDAVAVVVAASVVLNFLLAGLQSVRHAGIPAKALGSLHLRPLLAVLLSGPLTLGARRASSESSSTVALAAASFSIVAGLAIAAAVVRAGRSEGRALA